MCVGENTIPLEGGGGRYLCKMGKARTGPMMDQTPAFLEMLAGLDENVVIAVTGRSPECSEGWCKGTFIQFIPDYSTSNDRGETWFLGVPPRSRCRKIVAVKLQYDGVP